VTIKSNRSMVLIRKS